MTTSCLQSLEPKKVLVCGCWNGTAFHMTSPPTFKVTSIFSTSFGDLLSITPKQLDPLTLARGPSLAAEPLYQAIPGGGARSDAQEKIGWFVDKIMIDGIGE